MIINSILIGICGAQFTNLWARSPWNRHLNNQSLLETGMGLPLIYHQSHHFPMGLPFSRKDFAKALLQLFLELQIMDLLQNGPVAPVQVMLCLENGLDALKDGARPDKAVLSLIMCQ